MQKTNNQTKLITTAIALVLKRGTNNTKNRKRMSEAGLVMIAEITQTLDLKTASPSQLKGTDITLGRVLASFPDLACALIHRRPALMESEFNNSTLPRCLMFAGSAAVIPSFWTNTKQEQWGETVKFTEKITKKSKIDREKTADFWDTVHQSKAFDDDLRIELMTSLGILGDISSVSPEAQIAVNSWDWKPQSLFVTAQRKRKAVESGSEEMDVDPKRKK